MNKIRDIELAIVLLVCTLALAIYVTFPGITEAALFKPACVLVFGVWVMLIWDDYLRGR